MEFSAVLFDMDGVVIDTQDAVTHFWSKSAIMYGVELTDSDFVHHIYGCPATHTLSVLFSRLSPADKEAVLSEMAQVEAHMEYKAVNGALELLDKLRQRAIPTALVTSADPWKVSAVYAQLPLNDLFSVKVIGTDIERGKPYPECYLRAAALLSARPDQCVVFEDAISGVTAANAAGAFCVGVQRTEMANPLVEAGAQCTVADLREVEISRRILPDGHQAWDLLIGRTCRLAISSGQMV
jgi:HAD superfamily hydrolase (TIGR01509 family)